MAASLLPWNWSCDCFNKSLDAFNGACTAKKVAVVVVAVGVTVHFVRKTLKKRRQKQYKRDTVILHQIGRGFTVPSISPYVLKLETYLRIAKIPYEIESLYPFGPHGKMPWISYNDDQVPDSTLCIDYLNKKYDVNLNQNLSAEQLAVARSFQIMIDDYMFWAFALDRFVLDKTHSFLYLMRWRTGIPDILFAFVLGNRISKCAKAHGMGLHSKEIITEFARRDLKALSDYLDDKPFFFGSAVSEVDCALFGFLCEIIWTAPPNSLFEPLLNGGEFSNLLNYTKRMKALVWPDWDDCLDKRSS